MPRRSKVQRLERAIARPAYPTYARGDVGSLWMHIRENLGVGPVGAICNQQSRDRFGITHVASFDEHDERLEM